VDAHVAGHLLVLEGFAGVLPAAGAADRAVRDRHTVRGAQARKIPALHAAGKALADRGAADVDELSNYEVVGGDLGAERYQRVLGHPELGQLALGLDLGLGEIAAVGLDHVVGAALARAKLERDIAVLVLGPVCDHLALRQAQHRDRHVLTGIGEQPGHSDFLRNHSGTHLNSSPGLYSLISTSTPAARSSFISASTACGERFPVNFSILVVSGIGPRTCAPVRLAVFTISRVDASRMR